MIEVGETSGRIQVSDNEHLLGRDKDHDISAALAAFRKDAARKIVVEADRKTMRLLLTDLALYKYGTFVSNQYTNVFAGGFAFLKIYRDPEIETLLVQQSGT